MARIRLSPREKAVAAATAALREVDFPHLCRQLWAAGWTDKKPTGLPLQWRYTTPDGAKVFYAEAELMEHMDSSGQDDERGRGGQNEEQGHGDQDDEHGRGNQVGKHGRGG
ncbi:hypothetical protein PR002_g6334 [Phytophthora rubi]|uniref:Uncharacterized protein n=1 Tax=Phytophthora rubi TaxID=129364 RepID=A0A6A3N9B9_9STRA|nr:hypothetical protein PR002_g6334 [Phytophthora rubi]